MQPITQAGALMRAAVNIINQNFASAGIVTQGNVYWVMPSSGSDQNDGLSPQTPLRTVKAALGLCNAGQNDVVLLCAQGNTASTTTDYQDVTLDWNKNNTHLIGINSGPLIGQRARIAFRSNYVTASNLFTLSASACLISSVEFFAGVASALPTGCMKITGQRNVVSGCQVSGMGNALMDIAGAYSLLLSGAQENVIDSCYIGLDTVTLGAAVNSQILCGAAAVRNLIRNCKVSTFTNHATNNNFLRCPTGSLDRWLILEDCQFLNPIDAGSTNLTQAAVVASDAGGSVLPIGPRAGILGATDWNSTDSGNVRAINGSVTAGTFGLATAITR